MLRRTTELGPTRAMMSSGRVGVRSSMAAGLSRPARTPDNLAAEVAKYVSGNSGGPRPTAPEVARHAEARIEVMRLLRGIRVAQGLTETQIAARAGTTPRIIAALEKGDFARLPDWIETRRIVDRWVAGAGLDPRPALASLAIALEALGPVREPSPAGKAKSFSGIRGVSFRKQNAPATEASETKSKVPSFRFRLGLPPSRVTRWATVAVIAIAIGTTVTQTTVVAGANSKLPAPAERAVRNISDFIAVRFAPNHEGHRWIDVEDPRSRRGDKLRIGRHSD